MDPIRPNLVSGLKRPQGSCSRDLHRVMKDAGIDSEDIGSLWFSNCGWGLVVPPAGDDPGIQGQQNVRGHVAFAPLVNEGLFPKRVPCINVEGACASGSLAFHGAYKDILSGTTQVSLALGVEKTVYPKYPSMVIQAFAGGIDLSEIQRLIDQYQKVAAECREWKPV